MITNILNSIIFPIELLLASYICAVRINKRSYWGLRMVLSFFFACVFMASVNRLIPGNMLIKGSIAFLSTTLLSGLLLFWIYNITLKDSMYCCMIGYAMQHFASCFYILMSVVLSGNAPAGLWINRSNLLLYLIVYIISYGSLYLLFTKDLPKDGEYIINFSNSAEAFILVIPIALVLSLIEKAINSDPRQILICQVYEMIACALVLWVQYWQKKVVNLEVEMTVQERIFSERRRQFEQSISNIDVINHKCHDLKYQIQALKSEELSANKKMAIDEITNAVNFYDDSFQTDNEILNTALMEKSMVCRRYHISFSAIVDGKKLGFMNPMDLYVMLGNALDNAIEAVRKIKEEEKRVISMRVYAKEDLIILQIENTCLEETSVPEDGNLSTTKSDKNYHGYGIGSIRKIVEKYNGSLSLRKNDNMFILTAVFAR